MANPVKHDHADDDRGGGTLRPGVLYVPAYDDVSNATGAEAGDLVYATGNGTSTEGVYRYDGSSYTRLSGNSTLTDSGTDTDGGDNYQLPQAADNLDLQSDGAIQNAESVEADDVDIAGNDFVATGDWVARAYAVDGKNESTSSSSYSSYALSRLDFIVRWDDLFPGSQQGQVYAAFDPAPGTDQIDARVQNVIDGETVVEQTGITSGSITSLGPTNYTPTTTSSPIGLRFEFANGDNSTTVDIFAASIGVGVGV